MTGPFMPGGPVGPIPQQPVPLQLGGDFIQNPDNPQVGRLLFQVGPASFGIDLPSANVVAFLRSLTDNIERKLGPAVQIARPVTGLFLPNGNGHNGG